MSAIDVQNLSFSYKGNPVFKDISFKVEKGDFVGVIGPNGSGKSTLVKLLLKILTPENGQIKILGEDVNKFTGWSQVGYVSQKANSFNDDFPATVKEIVGINLQANTGIFKRKPADYDERVYAALKSVGMQDYQNKLIGKLSGGQQQRVFIARVLIGEPKIMFLDEPTVGIDAKSDEALHCLLSRLNEQLGITIIMVTHDIAAITVHANKLLCFGGDDLFVHDVGGAVTDEFLSKIYGYNVKHDCSSCEYMIQLKADE